MRCAPLLPRQHCHAAVCAWHLTREHMEHRVTTMSRRPCFSHDDSTVKSAGLVAAVQPDLAAGAERASSLGCEAGSRLPNGVGWAAILSCIMSQLCACRPNHSDYQHGRVHALNFISRSERGACCCRGVNLECGNSDLGSL